jgi:predicted nuclease of predicted toxin-antitoxin system
MKLLFDHNVSPRLPARLADIFPDASHVALLGLDQASDESVWGHAHTHGYVIVTKDADFSELSLLRGCPPKVIWLRIGNCTTDQITALLRSYQATILAFAADPEAGTLTLFPTSEEPA